ncbi:siderophore-interacting protein [Streptosporangium algeriense]|uniref:Siderophore-interacting protein n=1 Tax=Streptosporangium algeriense TaxID=1682748 RepID=A0ABW3DJI3_9ACTN
MAARGFQGAVMRGFGARDHMATVVRTSMVTPHMVRIHMSAPTLFDNATVGPTAWLRFWFPDPAGTDKEHQRAYTLVSCEPETGEFAVDVVLHEPAGPATTWARKAGPGDEIQVTSFGSSRFAVPDEPPAGYLLVGDPASVPAINGIVAVLPDDAEIALYLEKQHEEDELIPLTSHPGLRVRWVPRDGETSLAAAIDDRDWSNWYAWAATEAGSLKHLRKTLRDGFGFPKADTYAQAYWTYGRAMGSLRRTGEEETAEQAPAEGSSAARVPAAQATREKQAAQEKQVIRERQGRWRSQAAKELLAPVKTAMIVAGVVQAVVTLVQLAPFVLLADLDAEVGADDRAGDADEPGERGGRVAAAHGDHHEGDQDDHQARHHDVEPVAPAGGLRLGGHGLVLGHHRRERDGDLDGLTGRGRRRHRGGVHRG